ncbi:MULTISPECIES: transcriptional regulator domain-containing protein [unclassified Sphingobium]|uniref:transcriptional regulator domain-containing protein n=1 Tax=unclassified Sphingobium TaxID=2611147 RepID=UPI0035A59AF7
MLVRPAEPASYTAAARLGRSALAWEVLRRDPGYQHDAVLWRDRIGDPITDRAFTARWGLHFP